MKTKRTSCCVFLPIVVTLGFVPGGAIEAAGDRHPEHNCVFPPGVFMHSGRGGRVLDVTKPPFNARGDGRTDDTGALIRAYDHVLAQMPLYVSYGNGSDRPAARRRPGR